MRPECAPILSLADSAALGFGDKYGVQLVDSSSRRHCVVWCCGGSLVRLLLCWRDASELGQAARVRLEADCRAPVPGCDRFSSSEAGGEPCGGTRKRAGRHCDLWRPGRF